jgi:membrane protein implicated in regulation of membrane protease activity
MLRSSVLLLGAAAIVCGVVAMFAGCPPGWVFAFWGALVVLSLVYEKVRYKPLESAAPGPGWTKTAERFIDDETGEPVTVWLQPQTGERKYVRG